MDECCSRLVSGKILSVGLNNQTINFDRKNVANFCAFAWNQIPFDLNKIFNKYRSTFISILLEETKKMDATFKDMNLNRK